MNTYVHKFKIVNSNLGIGAMLMLRHNPWVNHYGAVSPKHTLCRSLRFSSKVFERKWVLEMYVSANREDWISS